MNLFDQHRAGREQCCTFNRAVCQRCTHSPPSSVVRGVHTGQEGEDPPGINLTGKNTPGINLTGKNTLGITSRRRTTLGITSRRRTTLGINLSGRTPWV